MANKKYINWSNNGALLHGGAIAGVLITGVAELLATTGVERVAGTAATRLLACTPFVSFWKELFACSNNSCVTTGTNPLLFR